MWALLVGHSDELRVSWVQTRPRVEVRLPSGRLVVYRPKVSGHMNMGPITTRGRVVQFGMGA